MKKHFRSSAAAVVAFFALFILQGCLKDSFRETYKIYTPIYKSLTQVRTDMKSGPAQPLQNIGKLNVFGHYIFLNEMAKGIHVIDNSNPASPRNLAFITVPNNIDIAVRGSYLYADSYSDIAVFDISDPTNVTAVKFMDNVIKDKNRYWTLNNTNPDSIRVVVGYNERDTTVDYREYNRWAASATGVYAQGDFKNVFFTSVPQVGISGSMSRFAIVDDYMYAVSSSELYSISLASPQNPRLTATKNMGWNIETLYPFQNKLFVGSQSGMFVYTLADPSSPTELSRFTHATSCDPVIADNDFAYVTLHSGTACNGTLNQLDVLNISNLSAPYLVSSLRMTSPHGLAKDGARLFICDGKDGLKLYDATNTSNLKLLQTVQGLETYDVIALGTTAVVVAKDGLYQFAYGSGNNITQLSKLAIETTK